MRDEFKPTTHSMMLQLNAWAIAYLGVALLVTGEGVQGFAYCAAHPHIMRDLLVFSACSQ